MMLFVLPRLVEMLNNPLLIEAGVIGWGSPVPVFGNIATSEVATLGLNPSNREFVNEIGIELSGELRRFHSLKSLDLESWQETEAFHLSRMMNSFAQYFFNNPYNGWFKRLDYVISGTGSSYYSASRPACHLDLIPFATTEKWNDLNVESREVLTQITNATLGQLLQSSSVRLLILNGATVVSSFERVSDSKLTKKRIPSWTLPRKNGGGVDGYAYKGMLSRYAGVELEHKILVLGFNHNLQSSYGVTSLVMDRIKDWISLEEQNAAFRD